MKFIKNGINVWVENLQKNLKTVKYFYHAFVLAKSSSRLKPEKTPESFYFIQNWITKNTKCLNTFYFTAAIGSPIVLGLNNTPDRVPDLCLFYNSDFIVYSSLSSFYIPCIIMVFLYWNIFKVSFIFKKYFNIRRDHAI